MTGVIGGLSVHFCPAGQSLHDVEPVASWYEPVGQSIFPDDGVGQ